MNDWTREFVVLDLETTGLTPGRDRVIEIAILHVCDLEERGTFSTLVDPEVPLSEKITEITGIRNEDLRGRPKFRDLADDILGVIGDCQILAYNTPFDTPFLAAELERVGKKVLPPRLRVEDALDPLVWVRDVDKFVPGKGRHQLARTAARWGVRVEGDPHRALTDCRLALGLARALVATGRIPRETSRLLRRQALRRQAQEAERRAFNQSRRCA